MAGVKGQRSGGQNAKTVQQHRLEGTYQRVRHAGIRNPEPPPGEPVPPQQLSGEAKAEWGRMIERLRQCQTLSVVDDAALYRYCVLHARAHRLELACAKLASPFVQDVFVDGAGVEHVKDKVHPGFAAIRTYDQTLRAYLVEFGLTPASRGRVKLPDKPKAQDPFCEFDGTIQ